MNFSGFNGSENLKNSLNALENGGRLPHQAPVKMGGLFI